MSRFTDLFQEPLPSPDLKQIKIIETQKPTEISSPTKVEKKETIQSAYTQSNIHK